MKSLLLLFFLLGLATAAERPNIILIMVDEQVVGQESPLTKKWELYDLSQDRTELSNLAQTHAKKVEELAAKWFRWAQETGVYPRPLSK
ncbi:hypothetical protein [Roseibacillus persicicus]|uniref:hypothetical protein n=1 Tax=Roseibacillus persicicus TaxID=454148 RepID=UPI00280DE139|nr:hypothetical protein [Roseibacillus persicicus]MDQ8189030.1 hypothetical protein [Roseibacillus persicicus]